MRGQPGHNTQPHARAQPSFQGIDAWITSELNEALVCKLRVSLMSLSDIFDIPSVGVLYNQALADVRSTGAGIKCLYCTSVLTKIYFLNFLIRQSFLLRSPRFIITMCSFNIDVRVFCFVLFCFVFVCSISWLYQVLILLARGFSTRVFGVD